uniref:Fpg/Nei family DNA glycosylase n=1 Tax=Actinotalea sp. C106 TaxID=2908644 RepID=UPI002541A10C
GEAEAALPRRGAGPDAGFPPEPVGQVRVRLLTEHTLADLRGPAACEVLTPEEVAAVVAKAGPDPLVSAGADAEEVVVENLRRRRTAVGRLLMDQTVVSGIGNIYRAEMLFRAGLDPHTPGRDLPAEVVRGLWQDWVGLLGEGVRTGVMVTRADLDEEQRELALTEPGLRHAVYGRAGEPCLVCSRPVVLEEMAGRKLYWCSTCQV